MRKLIILAVALMVAFVAVPAFASVQNVKVSGSIDTSYIGRDNFDLGENALPLPGEDAEDENQHLFMTQTILRVDADLTDQVSAAVQLINERVWNNDPGDDSDVSLNLAYVTLREMLYSPLTVVLGRQAFSYGNSFIMDSAGTNNAAPSDSPIQNVASDMTKQTSLDALRLIFDYNPLTLEILYSKTVTTTPGASFDNRSDDTDLYGINATYELGDDLNTQVETYFFARINKLPNDGTGNSDGTKSDTTYVPGLRASADVLDGLNVQGEVAWQRGNNVSDATTISDNEKREAMAAQIITNYQVPNAVLPDVLEEYNPALQYVYTYVSGDSNPGDRASTQQSSTNTDTAWDPFFENQNGGKIYNSLFDQTNLRTHAVSLTVNPIEDVTTKLTWTGLWLDKAIDEGTSGGGASLFTLDQPNAATGITVDANGNAKGAGYEIDFDTTYDYTEDVQFGASMGWFVPGDLFAARNDSMASQAIVHGIVNF